MLNDLAQRLSQELLQALPAFQQILPKRELSLLLESALAKLDLVTRSEFDAQSAVLERTRAKLEALEARCSELETQLNTVPTPQK